MVALIISACDELSLSEFHLAIYFLIRVYFYGFESKSKDRGIYSRALLAYNEAC